MNILPQKTNKAFSLIELSIVILIIGVLIAGVVSGSNLYAKFKITTAQGLTRGSEVNGIKNLVLWYETSLNESFPSGQNIEGMQISAWYDINPQKQIKNNATQSSSSVPQVSTAWFSQCVGKKLRINGVTPITNSLLVHQLENMLTIIRVIFPKLSFLIAT